MSRRKKFQPRPWFRHYAGARNDAKMKLLAFEDQRHFWAINEMKCEGELDKDDQTPELRERMIATGLGLDPPNAAEVKRRLMDVRLIDESWQPIAWDKRQFEGDFSTDRVRRHRALKRNVDVTLQGRYRNAPDADTESDTDKNRNRTLAREPALPKGAARAPSTEPTRTNRAQAATAMQRISERFAQGGGG